MSFLNAFGLLGRLFVAGALVSVAVAFSTSGDARVALLTVALSFGITGVVFAWIGARLGVVSALNKRLRETGVAGTAVITSVRETGVSVNNSPVIEFGLEVDTTAHAPYATTIRQRAPRLLIGTFPPGTAVAVMVDPANRDRLAIDWEAEARPEQSSATEMPGPEVWQASAVRDAAALLRTGRAALAVVTSMEDAGDMSELGLIEIGSPGEDDRLFIIGLEVKQPGLDAYEVRVAHRVPERLLGRVGPRTRVAVAVDRDDDHAVAIDWGSVKR